MRIPGALAPMVGLALFTVQAASAQVGNRCSERMTMELRSPASGVSLLDVYAQAGSLEIEGEAGLSEILVDAILCASSPDRMEGLDVTLDRDGSAAVLEAVIPERNGGWGSGYSLIHLVVRVPRGMAARVADGSGELRIEGVGPLDLGDGSGEIVLRDIQGDLTVDDGSGEIEIVGVEGSVRLDDGSGAVRISRVRGSVTLEDGSGQVAIEDVTGDVIVTDKGSGQIDVRNVGGDLRVKGTRRERIRYDAVRGTVDLPPARRRGRG